MTGEELICEVYVPEEPIQKLRALFSTHRLLRKQVTQLKNRIHSIFKQNLYPFTKEYIFGKARRRQLAEIDLHEADRLQIEVLLDQLSTIENKIKQLEIMIKAVGKVYYPEVEVLTSAASALKQPWRSLPILAMLPGLRTLNIFVLIYEARQLSTVPMKLPG